MWELHIFIIFLIFRGISCNSESTTINEFGIKPPCSEEKLLSFLADIQVINPESIVEWAVDSFEPLCRTISTHLKKIDNYLKTCDPTAENDLYMSLISGVKTLHEKVCKDSSFTKIYAKYYPCLHELRNDYESCNGPSDWNENPDKNEICKAYKDIVDCYYIKSAKVCGYKAAKTIKELIRDVIDSVIKVKCSGIGKNPYVADPMPEAYIKKLEGCNGCTVPMSNKLIILLIVILYTNR